MRFFLVILKGHLIHLLRTYVLKDGHQNFFLLMQYFELTVS